MDVKRRMIAVDDEVYGLITKECAAELLVHHPELLKTQVSINKILYHVAKYYLEN